MLLKQNKIVVFCEQNLLSITSRCGSVFLSLVVKTEKKSWTDFGETFWTSGMTHGTDDLDHCMDPVI